MAAIRKYDSNTFVGVLSVTELKLSHAEIYRVLLKTIWVPNKEELVSQSPTSELKTRREKTPFIDGSKLDSSPYQFQDPQTE